MRISLRLLEQGYDMGIMQCMAMQIVLANLEVGEMCLVAL